MRLIAERAALLAAQENEIVVKENPFRWVMFPVAYPGIFEFYKKLEHHFWSGASCSADDIAIQSDLTPLAASYVSLGGVELPRTPGLKLQDHALLASELSVMFQLPEARAFLGFLVCKAIVHRRYFAKVLDTRKSDELPPLSDELQAAIRARSEFVDQLSVGHRCLTFASEAERDASAQSSIYEMLVAFLCIYGVFSLEIVLQIQRMTANGEASRTQCLQKMLVDKMLCADFFAYVLTHLFHRLDESSLLEALQRAFALEAAALRALKFDAASCQHVLHSAAERLLAALNLPLSRASAILPAGTQGTARAQQAQLPPILRVGTEWYQDPYAIFTGDCLQSAENASDLIFSTTEEF